MTDFLVLSLAVLWVWEFVLVISPIPIPAIVAPLVVAGISYGALHVPHDLLTAAGIAGAVALLHLLIRKMEDPGAVLTSMIGRRSRPSRIPDLP